MDIWCCCQQCWPETPVVTWGHIARQQGTQYTVHWPLYSGPMAPCDINHPLVKSDIVSIYLKCKTCSPADILPTCHNHCWLLLNLTCHQWPRRDFVSDYYMESNYLWLLYCSELTRVMCSETFSTRRDVTGPGGGTSEHSSTVGATLGRSKYSLDLMTLSILDIQQWHY